MCGNCAFLLRGHWAKMLYEIAQVCWPFAELWRPGFSPPYFSYFYMQKSMFLKIIVNVFYDEIYTNEIIKFLSL